MPTYEYLCKACSHRFETWQKMVDEPLTTCPECGGFIRRVLYPSSIVFKGSGFYKTDHRGSTTANASENGHDGSKATESQGDADKKGSEKEAVGASKTPESVASSPGGESKASAATDSKVA